MKFDYRIYQLPGSNPHVFDRLGDENQAKASLDDYMPVWVDTWQDTRETSEQNLFRCLEDIFSKFNHNHPEHYAGRSLSVSDVIEVRFAHYHDTLFFYCDVFGFRKIKFI